ncbi:MAG: serine protease [Kordiimonas sp.]
MYGCKKTILLFLCWAIAAPLYAQEQPEIIETPLGKFLVERELQPVPKFGIRNKEALFDEPLRQSVKLKPYIENSVDLQRYILGKRVLEISPDEKNKFFQVVPGMPGDGQYNGQDYPEVQQGFSAACILAAKKYIEEIDKLLASAAGAAGNIAQTWHRNISQAVVDEYDRQCLRKVDDIPAEILKVTGVLQIYRQGFSVGFCSGTVISANEIMTARHCFFNESTGKKEDIFNWLEGGLLSFRTFGTNGVRNLFSLVLPETADTQENQFSARDDFIVLEIGESFAVHADIVPAQVGQLSMPQKAWLVGNNALLGDVLTPDHDLDFVRGVGPSACSVLKVTAQGCVYHSCQSGKTTSGGGVLLHDPASGSVTILGVHRGPAVISNACEASPPLNEIINVAAFAAQ